MAEDPHTTTPTYPDLRGKVAVVTGGSKGIGAATCRALVANGVKVAVAARDSAGIYAMIGPLVAAGGTVIGMSVEATDYSSIEELRRRVETELGPTDILMAFAGGFAALTPVTDITEEEWRYVLDSNLTSTFLACKSFLPGMVARRRGSIVTIASNAARNLDVTLTASYAAAKAGIVQFSRHVAKEVGPSGVRINCIAPATTVTERVSAIMTTDRLRADGAAVPAASHRYTH